MRRHFNRIKLAAFASLLSSALLAPPAKAQSAKVAAEALFEEGRQAMARSDFQTACAKFGESNRLDAAIGTALNWANCEEKRGRLATAWLLFKGVAARMSPEDQRLPIARQRVAELEQRLPRLRVKLAPGSPDDVRVRVGEAELTKASFNSPIPVDPGTRDVVVLVAGQPEQSRRVTFEEGRTTELVVPFSDASGPLEPQLRTDAPAPDPSPERSDGRATIADPESSDDRVFGLDRSIATYAAFGIGATGLLVGTITGVIGLNQEAIADAECNDETMTCNRRGYDANAAARTMAAVSTVSFIVGIAGAGAGTYLWVTASSPTQPGQAFALSWRGGW